MKELRYILKRMTNMCLAKQLGIHRSNITMWLLLNRVPKKRLLQLQKIKNDLSKMDKSLFGGRK